MTDIQDSSSELRVPW